MLIIVSVFTEVCVDDPAPESEPPTPSPTTEFSATEAPIINVTMTNSLITKLSPKSRTNGSSASQSSRSSTTQSEISSSDMSFQVREELFMRPILGLKKKVTGLLWTEGVAYNTNSQGLIMHSWDPFPGASIPTHTWWESTPCIWWPNRPHLGTLSLLIFRHSHLLFKLLRLPWPVWVRTYTEMMCEINNTIWKW